MTIPIFSSSAVIAGNTVIAQADEQFNILMNDIKNYVQNTYGSVANELESEVAAMLVDMQNIYDDFSGTYLGSKTADPLVDNNGNSLITGSLYFNSASGTLKVYNGASWESLPTLDVYSKTEVQNSLPAVGLNTTLNNTPSVGQINWNSDEYTANLGLPFGVTGQMFQESFIPVKNQAGYAILNGKPIMAIGTTGNSGRVLIDYHNGTKAMAKNTIGFSTHNIDNGADGLITVSGKVRNIDTTGTPFGETWENNDIIYIKPNTSGMLTKVEPADTELKMPIAFVIHAHTNGTLLIRTTPVDENSDKDYIATKVTKNANITAGTATKITYDAKGLVTGGTNPTTLSGYGITDSYTKTETNTQISNAVAGILDAAPSALDTLNELAAALGDDPNFATTTATAIGNKVTKNANITAGTFKSVTVDAKGLVTGGTNPTTLSGYGITDATPSSHVGSTGASHGVATTSVNGFMSSTDKSKLDGVASGATANTGTVTSVVAGGYLTGGTITSTGTIAVDATSANTASKVVARDASGNFSAGTITANLTGTASNADTLDGIDSKGFLQISNNTSGNIYGANKSGENNFQLGYWGGTSWKNALEMGGLASNLTYWDSAGSAKTIWNSGYMGAGTGLDADKLDGVEGTGFVKKNESGDVTQTTAGSYWWNVAGKEILWSNGVDINLGHTITGDLKFKLNKVWHAGNDGAGSTLDADTLDTRQATDFMYSQNAGTVTDLNNLLQSGCYRIQNTEANRPAGVDYGNILVIHGGNTDTAAQIVSDYGSNNLYWRSGSGMGTSATWGAWRRIWTDNAVSFDPGATPNTAVYRNASGNFATNDITISGAIYLPTNAAGLKTPTGKELLWHNDTFMSIGYGMSYCYFNKPITSGAGITIDNGIGDGAELALASSGYQTWWMDNLNGQYRLYHNGEGTGLTIDNLTRVVRMPGVYNTQSGTSANVFVDTDGKLTRITSSIKYKKNVQDVEKHYVDTFFDNARPRWYQANDNVDTIDKSWGYWGFIAEEVAEFDKRLVQFMRPTKTVEKTKIVIPAQDATYDEEGNGLTPAIEQELKTYTEEIIDEEAELSVEGIMYDRITVLLTAKVQSQQKEIDSLRTELDELKKLVMEKLV